MEYKPQEWEPDWGPYRELGDNCYNASKSKPIRLSDKIPGVIVCLVFSLMTLYPMIHATIHTSIDPDYMKTAGKHMFTSLVMRGRSPEAAINQIYYGHDLQIMNECFSNKKIAIPDGNINDMVSIAMSCMEETTALPIFDASAFMMHYQYFVRTDLKTLETFISNRAEDIEQRLSSALLTLANQAKQKALDTASSTAKMTGQVTKILYAQIVMETRELTHSLLVYGTLLSDKLSVPDSFTKWIEDLPAPVAECVLGGSTWKNCLPPSIQIYQSPTHAVEDYGDAERLHFILYALDTLYGGKSIWHIGPGPTHDRSLDRTRRQADGTTRLRPVPTGNATPSETTTGAFFRVGADCMSDLFGAATGLRQSNTPRQKRQISTAYTGVVPRTETLQLPKHPMAPLTHDATNEPSPLASFPESFATALGRINPPNFLQKKRSTNLQDNPYPSIMHKPPEQQLPVQPIAKFSSIDPSQQRDSSNLQSNTKTRRQSLFNSIKDKIEQGLSKASASADAVAGKVRDFIPFGNTQLDAQHGTPSPLRKEAQNGDVAET